MTKVPDSFAEALKCGYRITRETSAKQRGKRRIGTLHLKNRSRHLLIVKYAADASGYAFGKPKASTSYS